MLGRRHGLRVPKRLSLHTATRKELLPATGVAWLNLPLNVMFSHTWSRTKGIGDPDGQVLQFGSDAKEDA